MKNEKRDVYGEITNQIIKAIEAGAENYQMLWHVNGADTVLRVNASTHRPYPRYQRHDALGCCEGEVFNSLWATYQQ